ncbi:hypothetical protein C8T65DRAFT_588366 [Cerioporus squamosus]|nr:hypothetical protein C8T65DRAFT_589356 [Cerioporus squamosus]KAI0689798.1 hypothetical protein C8T65DRAFT_588366 [Cerioporus squamosus]
MATPTTPTTPSSVGDPITSVPPSTRSPSPAGDDSGPPAGQPILKKTKTGNRECPSRFFYVSVAHLSAARLGSVDTEHGIVAGPGFSEESTFTTPNADYVPKFAVARSEITTYADGRWGCHEYSRWPQQFSRDAFYLVCIPRHPSQDVRGPSPILWRTITASDWKLDKNCGIPGVGRLAANVAAQLNFAAVDAFAEYHMMDSVPPEYQRTASFLMLCVRHTLDRMRGLPAPSGVIISLAAHIQRLTLEFWGLLKWLQDVYHVVKDGEDYRTRPWDVLGAQTPDLSDALVLHRAGIPVWFQQRIRHDLVVYQVVEARTLPDDFSQVPSYPRLVLAKRDLSGALNMPGEWRRAMDAVVRRQLLISRLPELLNDGDQDGPPTKRLREGAMFVGEGNSSLGPAAPVFFLQGDSDAKSVGHSLPAQPVASSSRQTSTPTQPSRRARARAKKHALAASTGVDLPPPPPQNLIPARQWYAFEHAQEYGVWARALAAVSPLPQPRSSVKYYFAPPWMLDTLQGYPADPKTSRYLHQWISIRIFCRMRLFDQTIDGRPLTIAEWRDALWGDYNTNETGLGAPPGVAPREATRHSLRANIRRLFGKVNALPSYHVGVRAELGETVVTSEMAATDMEVRQRAVWEACETNWRCELLALDALMVGTNDWPQLERWVRESDVSQVWGPGTSGMDVVPAPHGPYVDCWKQPGEVDWQSCRPHLAAFIAVLARWPGFPEDLRGGDIQARTCEAEDHARLCGAAIDFYISCFVSRFGRLPIAPVRPPLDVGGVLPSPSPADAPGDCVTN